MIAQRFISTAVFSICAGCPLAAEVEEIATDGARSLLYFRLERDRIAEARAFAIEGEDRPFLTMPRIESSEVEIFILDYPCGLEALGLNEGPIELDASAEFALPAPSRIRSFRAARSEVLNALPAALAGVRYRANPPETSCLELDLEKITFSGEQISVAAAHGDTLIVGTVLYHYQAMHASGTLDDINATWGGTPWFDLTGTRLGWYYSVGPFYSSSWRTFEGPSINAPEIAGRDGVYRSWIDGDDDGSKGDVFVLTDTGSFVHYNGSSWDVVHQADSVDLEFGGLAWVATGEAFATGLSDLRSDQLGHFVDGAYRVDDVPFSVRSLGRLQQNGEIVAGALDGAVYRYDGAAFVLAAPAPARSEGTTVIAALENGYLYGGPGGRLFQSPPYCPEIQLGEAIDHLVALENSWIAISGNTMTRLIPKGRKRIPGCFP